MFLKRSLVFPILLFSSISLYWSPGDQCKVCKLKHGSEWSQLCPATLLKPLSSSTRRYLGWREWMQIVTASSCSLAEVCEGSRLWHPLRHPLAGASKCKWSQYHSSPRLWPSQHAPALWLGLVSPGSCILSLPSLNLTHTYTDKSRLWGSTEVQDHILSFSPWLTEVREHALPATVFSFPTTASGQA